jgi:hypothetical protein
MNIRKMFDRSKCRIGLHEWEPPFIRIYGKCPISTTPMAEGQPAMPRPRLPCHKKQVFMGEGQMMCSRCGIKKLKIKE